VFINQSLAELANPLSSLTLAHSWHTQSGFDTFSSHAKRIYPLHMRFASRIHTAYLLFSGAKVKRMPARTAKRKQDQIEVRLTAEAKAPLKRAASVERKTVSAFALEKGMAAAAETLAERREFRLPAKKFDAFVAALDAPAKARSRLERLLKSPSVLELETAPPGHRCTTSTTEHY
jgi:uncharacterized protein (DUF1778 family)